MKFKFGQKVKLVAGFYEGREGVVEDYDIKITPRLFRSNIETIIYRVIIKDLTGSDRALRCRETSLEEIKNEAI